MNNTESELREEIRTLRNALSLIATNLGNGAAASPDASLNFLCEELPKEVKLVCDNLRRQNTVLRAIQQQKPVTAEQALAQYNRIKQNSTRNKGGNSDGNV